MCAKYLRRHPSEVALPPNAFVELMALEELLSPNICPRCQQKWRVDQLEKHCEVCGCKYQDPDIERQIANQ